ncbi:MAG: hypothetical protein N4A76_06235 [Firmicutes bacterium]|jgi:tetratricopeptide (TPR) repeat protein|nr:hypothetical protein [Bacillota bacterium]
MDIFNQGFQLMAERRFDEAIEYFGKLSEEHQEDQKIHYWSLKYIADIIGNLAYKDYGQAIDIYQRIINEYELEDNLYEMCQMDMASAYLEMGTTMIQTFDEVIDNLIVEDEKMFEIKEKLLEKRNDFIESEAEKIYKSRM